MGPPETATRRLNFAQAFNPLGSLAGMPVAREMILHRLNPSGDKERLALATSDPATLAEITRSDIAVVVWPYLLVVVVALVFVAFLLTHLPKVAGEEGGNVHPLSTLSRLLKNRRYVGGVIAQTLYVGTQIMVWTFIIHYGVDELVLTKADA